MKRQLESIKQQLLGLAPEDESRFTVAANLVHRARAIAIENNHPNTTVAGIRVDQLAPATALEIVSSLIGGCPESKTKNAPALLTIKQAAEYANVSTRTLYRLTHLHTKINGAVRIKRSDLDHYLEAQFD